MKVISFCVFGQQEVYLRGVCENLRRIPEIYPGWQAMVFTEADRNFRFLKACRALGAEIILKPPVAGAGGMFWRFEPVDDPRYEAVIVRDADSLVSKREQAAVDEWLRSPAVLHVMHDSHHHWDGPWPVLGGMWGAKRGAFPIQSSFHHLLKWWQANRGPFEYFADQWFLKRYVWPHVRRTGLIHSSNVHSKYGGNPFPESPASEWHVGERVPADRLPSWEPDVFDEMAPPQIPPGTSLTLAFESLCSHLDRLRHLDRAQYLYGTHLEVLRDVLAVLHPTSRDIFLEFGGGNFSTGLLLSTGARVITVEQGQNVPAKINTDWLRRLRETYQEWATWDLMDLPGITAWRNAFYPPDAMLCFVDGNGDCRKEIVEFMLARQVRVIVAHDSETATFRYNQVATPAGYSVHDFRATEVWTRVWSRDRDLSSYLDGHSSYRLSDISPGTIDLSALRPQGPSDVLAT
jgi:hypothetical protein